MYPHRTTLCLLLYVGQQQAKLLLKEAQLMVPEEEGVERLVEAEWVEPLEGAEEVERQAEV